MGVSGQFRRMLVYGAAVAAFFSSGCGQPGHGEKLAPLVSSAKAASVSLAFHQASHSVFATPRTIELYGQSWLDDLQDVAARRQLKQSITPVLLMRFEELNKAPTFSSTRSDAMSSLIGGADIASLQETAALAGVENLPPAMLNMYNPGLFAATIRARFGEQPETLSPEMLGAQFCVVLLPSMPWTLANHLRFTLPTLNGIDAGRMADLEHRSMKRAIARHEIIHCFQPAGLDQALREYDSDVVSLEGEEPIIKETLMHSRAIGALSLALVDGVSRPPVHVSAFLDKWKGGSTFYQARRAMRTTHVSTTAYLYLARLVRREDAATTDRMKKQDPHRIAPILRRMLAEGRIVEPGDVSLSQSMQLAARLYLDAAAYFYPAQRVSVQQAALSQGEPPVPHSAEKARWSMPLVREMAVN